jgi:hypothetical protein
VRHELHLQLREIRKNITMTKRAKLKRDAVTPFRDKLWDLFSEQASSMGGADVVLALRQAGEEIWAVVIDSTYSSMKHQDDEALGNAFDITWLTVVCIKLKEIKAKSRERAQRDIPAKRRRDSYSEAKFQAVPLVDSHIGTLSLSPNCRMQEAALCDSSNARPVGIRSISKIPCVKVAAVL